MRIFLLALLVVFGSSAVADERRLEIFASGESWIEVRNQSGKLLYAELMGPEVESQTFNKIVDFPVELLIGSISKTIIMVDGVVLSLGKLAYQDVVRVVLDEPMLSSQGVKNRKDQEKALEEAFKQAEAEARALEELKKNEDAELALLNRLASEKAVSNVLDAMDSRITRSWRRPVGFKGGLEVYLQVGLASNGELVDVRIANSSGDALFDRSALTAVKRAAPFGEVTQFDTTIFEEKFKSLTVRFFPEGSAKNSEQRLVTKRDVNTQINSQRFWTDRDLESYKRGDFQTAFRQCKALAEKGDKMGQNCLGDLYISNLEGVPFDYSKGYEWYRRAAEQGLWIAQQSVAILLEQGWGVDQNYVEALKWARLAAEQGDQLSLAKIPKLEALIELSNTPSVKENSDEISLLRQRLAQLESEKSERQRVIDGDVSPPSIRVTKSSQGARGTIAGTATDNTGIAEVLVDGQAVAVDPSGRFTTSTFIPSGGINVQITAYDLKGLSTTETIRLEREVVTQVEKISFDRLNPTTRQVKANSNAIALIVGVAEYEKTAGAEFADKDAQVFYDYAHLKLGIPQNRIQTLVNDKADVVGLLTGVNKWLKRSVKQGESDVYIFFAGHGLASDDGDTAYLIPYDGAPDFLERTAISRDEVFREVSSVNPRSVTVFLDTCYSGDTRGESRLIAGRPLGIKLQEQSLPEGFTVLTAAGGDQIAKPLKEAQHGMFSYFLMKGMEGDADADGNNEITARELHSYVRENVVQQSGGSQVPELQGDGEKVLVRFQ